MDEILFFEINEYTQRIVHIRPKVAHVLTRLTLGTRNVRRSSHSGSKVFANFDSSL